MFCREPLQRKRSAMSGQIMWHRRTAGPKFSVLAAALLAASASIATTAAEAPKLGDPPEASNMRLVGYNDLQGRSAYQPTIHRQGDRWFAYIGHHGGTETTPKPVNALNGRAEFNGTSIIDVTDVAHPVYVAHIPG